MGLYAHRDLLDALVRRYMVAGPGAGRDTGFVCSRGVDDALEFFWAVSCVVGGYGSGEHGVTRLQFRCSATDACLGQDARVLKRSG